LKAYMIDASVAARFLLIEDLSDIARMLLESRNSETDRYQ
jgi:hypothetical protein